MGAEFILYTLPSCEMTTQRAAALEQCLAAVPEEDLAELASEYGDTDEARQRIREAIGFVSSARGRRDVSEFYVPGMPYRLQATGGLSWGDFPTDAAGEFALIGGCRQLFAQVAEWARCDLEASFTLCSHNALPGGLV